MCCIYIWYVDKRKKNTDRHIDNNNNNNNHRKKMKWNCLLHLIVVVANYISFFCLIGPKVSTLSLLISFFITTTSWSLVDTFINFKFFFLLFLHQIHFFIIILKMQKKLNIYHMRLIFELTWQFISRIYKIRNGWWSRAIYCSNLYNKYTEIRSDNWWWF